MESSRSQTQIKITTKTSMTKNRKPTVLHSALTLFGLAAWISFGLFYLKVGSDGLHGLLLTGLIGVVISSIPLRASLKQVRAAMADGMDRAMPAMFIFLTIGIVIATFILGGTVGTLIYYGLKFMHPAIFLPAGLILCSLMSVAVGTSWGTVGTGGIVLIGVGAAMGIPLPIVAGMIVSGASFGDKMSPVSDTTNLSALSAETDLYAHIKSMAYTTIPAYLITLAAFSWMGLQFADQPLPQERLDTLLLGLENTFNINIIMLLPLVVLLYLSMKGIVAEAGMMIASLVAAFLAIAFQGFSVSEVIQSFYGGAKIVSGVAELDPLLNRGGITEMAWTFTLSFVAISLGAVLEHMGFLQVMMNWLLKKIQRAASVVTAAISGTFLINLLLGESYVSIVLSGQMFKKKFDDVGVDRRVLSRSIEEGGTLMTALIPWTTTGAFYTATLGVSTLDYAGWSLLNWINPLLGILFAWLGIALFRTHAAQTPEAKTA